MSLILGDLCPSSPSGTIDEELVNHVLLLVGNLKHVMRTDSTCQAIQYDHLDVYRIAVLLKTLKNS